MVATRSRPLTVPENPRAASSRSSYFSSVSYAFLIMMLPSGVRATQDLDLVKMLIPHSDSRLVMAWLTAEIVT